MSSILVSLPDVCKTQPGTFTLGKPYLVLGLLGNGVIVLNNYGHRAIILSTRLSEQP